MDQTPFFTIGVPTFNRAEFLRECLANLLQQTFDDFELIVADDHSTDHTPDVVSSFHDPRLRCVRHEHNLGVVNNFRFLLREARGHYFALNQDDDLLHHEFLRRCHQTVTRDPDVVVYASPWWRGAACDGLNAKLMTVGFDSLNSILRDQPLILDGSRAVVSMLYSFHFMHPSLVLRTDDFRAAGGYAEVATPVSDLLGTARTLLRGRLAYDPRAGAIFRDHGGNYSANMSPTERRQRHIDRYAPLIAELESHRVDWRAHLAEDLGRMALHHRLDILRQWVRARAPTSLVHIGWQSVRNTPGVTPRRLRKMMRRRLGWRNTLRFMLTRLRAAVGVQPPNAPGRGD